MIKVLLLSIPLALSGCATGGSTGGENASFDLFGTCTVVTKSKDGTTRVVSSSPGVIDALLGIPTVAVNKVVDNFRSRDSAFADRECDFR